MEYEAIGTPEECRAAVEKQRAKKPIRKPWTITKCPTCGADLGEWLEDGYTKDWESLKFCECGQRIQWRD